ncbi:MAG: hypothetical protein IJZ79_02735 [Bacilli bacterium]|nr:hypothetical protein [Bacilli bacterium]MBQ8218641.1 hypothetical protein [Bacilli bacterium]
MDLVKERQELFDEKFRLKSSDAERVKEFCKEISKITGVQVCNDKGMIYEYIPQVYQSAVKKSEM